MNRSPILVPLLSFVAINVGLDFIAGIALLTSNNHELNTMWQFLFTGLLWGQFGLCCGARLRFEAMRYFIYLGMLLIPVLAIGFLWPTIGYRDGFEFIAIVMLAVGFTALFCLGPRSLIDWPGLENRFTIKQMLVGTIFIAFGCVIVMHLPMALTMGFSILVLSLPSIIASNLLVKAEGMIGYSWMMIAGLTICLLFITIEPRSAPIFGFFMAQIMVLWLGGLMLISTGQGSSYREVVGLPEE